MRMQSTNAHWWKQADTLLSTVKLPTLDKSELYETCLFIGRDSEVLAQHDNPYDARFYHIGKARELGLKGE